MKKIKSFLVLFAVSILSFSCSLSEAVTISNEEILQAYINAMTQGDYKVVNYSENNQDQTTLFQDYLFRFNSIQDIVTARKGDLNVAAPWLFFIGDDGDNGSASFNFTMNFTENEILERLAGEWVVESSFATEISLIRTNPASGVTYRVTFERVE
jgi:hypothetical protein